LWANVIDIMIDIRKSKEIRGTGEEERGTQEIAVWGL
jgi:hypothetical protein